MHDTRRRQTASGTLTKAEMCAAGRSRISPGAGLATDPGAGTGVPAWPGIGLRCAAGHRLAQPAHATPAHNVHRCQVIRCCGAGACLRVRVADMFQTATSCPVSAVMRFVCILIR